MEMTEWTSGRKSNFLTFNFLPNESTLEAGCVLIDLPFFTLKKPRNLTKRKLFVTLTVEFSDGV